MKIVVLDSIRSALNVGAIFRTSSGIGVDKIYLCGITPTPFENSKKYQNQNKKRKDFIKTSLGAEDEIKWEYKENTFDLIKELKEKYKEINIIALEQGKTSLDYKMYQKENEEKLKNENNIFAIIIGNEVEGIGDKILKEVDVILEIPMLGLKESLNVTIAFAILMYRLFDYKNLS